MSGDKAARSSELGAGAQGRGLEGRVRPNGWSLRGTGVGGRGGAREAWCQASRSQGAAAGCSWSPSPPRVPSPHRAPSAADACFLLPTCLARSLSTKFLRCPLPICLGCLPILLRDSLWDWMSQPQRPEIPGTRSHPALVSPSRSHAVWIAVLETLARLPPSPAVSSGARAVVGCGGINH